MSVVVFAAAVVVPSQLRLQLGDCGVERGVKVVILDMADVPVIDATGLVALESAIARLNGDGVKVILAGVGGQVLHAFARAGWRNRKGRLRIFQSFDSAVARAREHVAAP